MLGKVLPNIVKRFITWLSKKITVFYIIHWFVYAILYIAILMIDESYLIPNPGIAVVIGVVVFIISTLLCFCFEKIKF